MKRDKVKSSNIVSIGWEKGFLEVEFNSGTYRYEGVPEHIYRSLMESESKGKFIASMVKPLYRASKIPALALPPV